MFVCFTRHVFFPISFIVSFSRYFSLPVILRQLDDLETFKADLKTHLFRQV